MPKATITCNTADAQIRYTIDNSNVTESSPIYNGNQIELSCGDTIKAKAYKSGMNESNQISLVSLNKIKTPNVAYSRKGPTVIIFVENIIPDVTYVYNMSGIPQNLEDGTIIENTSEKEDELQLSFEKEEAFQIWVRGFSYGKYNPSDSGTMYIKEYTPVDEPMVLGDGSFVFYDRGPVYGDYFLDVDGRTIRRLSDGADDGSADSRNWRFLIFDKSDLDIEKKWGPYGVNEGLTGFDVGYGLPNTNKMIAKYGDNDDYIWKFVKQRRDETGYDWFIPSKSEYSTGMTSYYIGGVESLGASFSYDSYYTSTDSSDTPENFISISSIPFKNNFTNISKNNIYHCRLIRRI